MCAGHPSQTDVNQTIISVQTQTDGASYHPKHWFKQQRRKSLVPSPSISVPVIDLHLNAPAGREKKKREEKNQLAPLIYSLSASKEKEAGSRSVEGRGPGRTSLRKGRAFPLIKRHYQYTLV